MKIRTSIVFELFYVLRIKLCQLVWQENPKCRLCIFEDSKVQNLNKSITKEKMGVNVHGEWLFILKW